MRQHPFIYSIKKNVEAIDKKRHLPQPYNEIANAAAWAAVKIGGDNAIPALTQLLTSTDEGKIEIGYQMQEEKVLLWVQDTGVGIDKKYEGKIFGKFVQLNNVYSKKESSTGLGLTITIELVELHHGKIWFESVVGEGTTFFVELPLEQPKNDEANIKD